MILILLLASIIFYLHLKKPNPNKIIDDILKQEERNEEDNEHKASNSENTLNEDDAEIEPIEQFKDIIVEAFIGTFDFFTNKNINIVAVGDSLTQGVGDQSGQGGYVGIIDRTINHSEPVVHFDNFGKSGNRTDQLLARLDEPEIVDALKDTHIVLITIGANDIMRVAKENFTNLTYEKFAEEQEHFENRLHEIFKRIRDINDDTQIYLLGIYNPFEKYFPEVEELNLIVDDWNNISKKTVKSYDNSVFIPIKDLFDDAEADLLSGDNFHPNITGYELMAERVIMYLRAEER